jgi:hypothetical protein
VSFLEEIVDDLERVEQDNEMYWSTYYIPPQYQPLEDSPQ